LAQHELTATQVSAALTQLRRWLQDQVLHQSVDTWLAKHHAPEALLNWCQAHSADLPPLRFLAASHAQAAAIEVPAQPLKLLDPDPATQFQHMHQMAHAIAHQAGFAQHPDWQGQCLETGAWTRLRQRQSPTALSTMGTASVWSRLASRWLEVLELSLADQQPQSAAPLLSNGALPLGDGQAIAWSEMARGLLLHWVQLDTQGRVTAYQVVAPTEWNFHPQGTLAQALAQAFDACVACQVGSAHTVELCDA